MRRSQLPRVLIYILILGIAVVPVVACAQESENELFPETGHSVRGEFLKFFSSRGGVRLFGPPTTPEMVEDGVRVQYLRNVRLEWHPENPRPYRVQLGLLGALLQGRQPPLPSSQIPPANRVQERFYPQTGHTVKLGFLTFFDQYGGLDVFGFPITEVSIDENNRIVQWFQKARLEWYSDDVGGQARLAPLGEIVLKKRHPEMFPQEAARPSPTGEIRIQSLPGTRAATLPSESPSNLVVMSPMGLRVTATVQSAITGGQPASTQRVFVYVTDEKDNGIPNARAELMVIYPFGTQKLPMPPTDAKGFTSLPFGVSQVDPGSKVVIVATASYAGQAATTETSFSAWY